MKKIVKYLAIALLISFSLQTVYMILYATIFGLGIPTPYAESSMRIIMGAILLEIILAIITYWKDVIHAFKTGIN